MPSAVSGRRSSYRRLVADLRVTEQNANNIATTDDTAAEATAAGGGGGGGDGDAGVITCRDVGDIRCSHAIRDSTCGVIKKQVTT